MRKIFFISILILTISFIATESPGYIMAAEESITLPNAESETNLPQTTESTEVPSSTHQNGPQASTSNRSRIITYTVKYNANGGFNAPAPQIKTHGKNLTLRKTIPQKTGYIFQGWAIRSGSNIVKYKPEDIYSENKDICLHAIWKIRTYTISYNANKGKGAPQNQKKTYGTPLTLRTTKPIRDGYTFIGWAEKSNSVTATYKAGEKYTKNATKITYNPSAYYLDDESESLYALWAKTKKATFNDLL